ncbi:hypothetical protein MCOR10_006829 [Pyricularia oryzae]|nr:hypothetical protein MCOR10_006829 [Pyricularia oryzae]
MEVPWDEAADGPMPEWMRPKAWYLPEMESIESPDGDFYLPFNKGGFCPIELDILLNERYRVIAFAGHGSFAMVWVAIDEKHRPEDSSPKYVAIKVSRGLNSAEEAQRSNEEASLRRLMKGRAGDAPGSRHIVQLLDAFDIESPNGIHRCLVLEQAGSPLVALDGVARFSEMIKIFRQCAAAVEYMHSMGVVHGAGLEIHPTITLRKAFIGAKRGVNTHIYNTPPELIEDEEATCKADIWSLGCILWHLWFGCHLMENYVVVVDHKDDAYGHQRSFLDCTRSERKENLVAYVDGLYGDSSAKKPAFDALLELILDCTEPNPDDRPTAHEIVSSKIWEEKVLPTIGDTSKDSPDETTGAAQPSEAAASASDQAMPESEVLVASQNGDFGGDAVASEIVTAVSGSSETHKSNAEPVSNAHAAVAATSEEASDRSLSNPQEKMWKLWWPFSIVQDWFRALWNWRK